MRLGIAALALAAVALAGPAAAQQQEAEVPRLGDSRERLEQVLAGIEQRLATEDLHEEDRELLTMEAAVVRSRLTEGDFHVGDQVYLYVRNEEELTDTFTVAPGPLLVLPIGGEVELGRLLRSELEPALLEHLGRYIREPQMRAQALVRISVVGEVSRPGFYVLPADVSATEALTVAGGPTRTANLDEVRVERRGDRVWDGEPFALALNEGRTFDQLGIRAGDQFVVPESRSTGDTLRILLISVPTAIFALSRIF
ncbi:MAG TPA: SLBB domain-containing protein [Longimicrobiales bacterium]|nr:SLBB domain-containing protein [Longimicrobiales bacterium]